MAAYYNEHDPQVAAWLRELIAEGLIAEGDVDARSIEDVSSDDVRGFTQCHFFAGIGGWSYALRLAGWDDDRPVWTGSCPCQPFSAAGKGDGAADRRHLWPSWVRLIQQCRPAVVFGEQVASTDGLAWLDRVSTDLEAADYAVGAVDLGAASVGAFHIRQRLWFVADTKSECTRNGIGRERGIGDEKEAWDRNEQSRNICLSGRVADTGREGAARIARGQDGAWLPCRAEPDPCGDVGELGHAEEQRWQRRENDDDSGRRELTYRHSSPWADAVWIPCRDGRYRPTQPGLFPLAHGLPGRVGLLRGAGNSIVPQVAAAFIASVMEAL